MLIKKIVLPTIFLFLFPFCTGQTAQKTGDGKHSQTPTGQTTATTGVEQAEGDGVRDKPSNEDVYKVSIVPPPAKDGWDKTYVITNVMLALIGIGGIIVAVCTLRKIETQAGEMTLQRKAMQDTLTEIKRQADLMKASSDLLIDERRARLHVELSPTELPCLAVGYQREMSDGGEHFAPHCLETDEFKVSIRNEGNTSAYNTSATITVCVMAKGEVLLEREETKVLKVVKADAEEFASIEVFPGIPQDVLDRVHIGEAFVEFSGFVRYDDAFRKGRTSAFGYAWELREFDIFDDSWASEIQLIVKLNEMT